MRFGVLGPLGVWTTQGRPVRVPELKVRALLTALLIHRGRPVSVDRLIDDMWGTQLPSNPAGVLQNKVWQLRRALEDAAPGGRDLVVSRPPGYQLQVPADAVDADRFHDLTARARESAEPRARAELLTEALALWRGPAYADFVDEEFTRAAADRLEEQRLTTLEEQADARLELGEHALVADELSDLVALHPLRERLRTAHIRALYLAGRQSAALSSYAELRERLADELGVDPGPELAALHQAILTQSPALTAVPSPSTTAARPPSNIPTAPGRLIGRDATVEQLRDLLDRHRLVTLTGSGGVGKTQLALATAAALGPRFPGGVWLAEFASLDPSPGSATEVQEVVEEVLGVRDDTTSGPGPDGDPLSSVARVVRALGDADTLLVFDNCEHVVAPVAELTGRLLKAVPRLRVMTTSQAPLSIAGETLVEVEPLRLPQSAAGLDADDVLQFSAVELFATRAAAAAPRFRLTDETVAPVVSVCHRLDGIPLALEMAATRVRALGVHELAARLDDRFTLLAGGARDAPARQRTLRAVIDWSWELLSGQERAVLRRLAVHADGCSLASAEEVCAGPDVDRAEVLDLLARLVDCSLVVMADGVDGPRYRLLESVTAYCLEHLAGTGELEALQQRHRAYYTSLAERAEPHLSGHGQREWLRRLDSETANLRNALEHAVSRADTGGALRLVNALAWYWHLRGRNREAARSLTQALSLVPDGEAVTVEAAAATAWLGGVKLLLGGSKDPLGEYRTALRAYDELDDPGGRARAEWFLGSNLYGIGDLSPSEELIERALMTFRSRGDRWGTAASLSSRAFLAKLRGRFGELRRYGEQSLEIFSELGDRWGQLRAMVPLQTLAEVVGDYERAGRLYRDGLRMAEDLGLWPEVSFQLSGLGRISLLTRDYALAREFHERARRLAVEQSDDFGEQFAEIGLGMGARREGDLETAEHHMHNVLDVHRRMGYQPGVPSLILAELGFVAELRGDVRAALELQRDGLTAAESAGDPRGVALALEGLAGAELLAGHAERAARLLGAAAGARERVGTPLPGGERADVDRIFAGAREALGEEGFAAAFERGRTE
ncbi:BTAD domain-containing putative transcriptional regulator [Streptomyces luteolus]|uniref:BTAD domain-containing putative transcriptional regulator n=1 Tax=Streptomyces luteolus TaxID=3043615 RepID=A0ABT6T685_9ACTN|nr:BTAD domain-containing putative transcriptional regulator [Streptomyces sp. B-S-A12]MDI3422905.1 BTAD domain-containing putative transcriptional regulator [Streptomyces sp. B-S-A12]